MNENERDTHFHNAAKLLSERLSALYLRKGLDAMLGDPNGEIKEQESLLFAQFAFDVACHVASFMTVPEVQRMCAGTLSPAQAIQHIPDLAEWPNTSLPPL